MIAAVLLATAFLAQQTSVPPAPSTHDGGESKATPIQLFDIVPRSPDQIALHSQILAGSRDPVWSPRTEAALSQAYHDAPDFSDGVESLTVICTVSLCEVQATTRAGLSKAAVEAFMESMPAPALFKLEDELKLRIASQSANATGYPAFDKQYVGNILAYWQRADGL